MKIKWFKKNEKAIVPTKYADAAGFDIYTIEDFVVIPPHSQYLFSTGLAVAADPGYWLMVFDRGSTGSKGMHTHCGVVDNDYRGELFICIKNDNSYPVVVTRSIDKPYLDSCGSINDYSGPIFYYPACKAIAQIIPIAQPEVESEEVNELEWITVYADTKRGDGKLGSSGK